MEHLLRDLGSRSAQVLSQETETPGAATNRTAYSSKNILNRWKYKVKKNKTNRFLDAREARFILLYENVVDSVSQEYNNAYCLFDTNDFLRRLRAMAKELKYWDRFGNMGSINPIELASKGWYVPSIPLLDASSENLLKLKCCCCEGKLTLKIDGGDDDNYDQPSNINDNKFSISHSNKCPWRHTTFPTEKEYYLNESNLIYDIERINHFKSLKMGNIVDNVQFNINDYTDIVSMDNFTKLSKVFNFKSSHDEILLFILLQGYQIIVSENIQQNKDEIGLKCEHCLHHTSVDRIIIPTFNGHKKWCRYSNKNLLPTLLVNNVQKYETCNENDKNIENRLNKLNKYFQGI